jgi:hypothetical protein
MIEKKIILIEVIDKCINGSIFHFDQYDNEDKIEKLFPTLVSNNYSIKLSDNKVKNEVIEIVKSNPVENMLTHFSLSFNDIRFLVSYDLMSSIFINEEFAQKLNSINETDNRFSLVDNFNNFGFG